MPVILPSGRVKLAIRPSATGSAPVANTIGMVVVAVLAAIAGLCRPRDDDGDLNQIAANAGSRSTCLSAQRYSIETFRPST